MIKWRWATLGILTIALALIGLLSMTCGPLRVHTYLIPSKIEPHWITIEYDNPKCAPLKEGAFGREFVIPESGFLCTSSSMYTGWHREKYYSVDGNNNRTALQTDERIFRLETFNINQPSSDAGLIGCKVTGEEFFYGTKEKLVAENPIMQDESVLTQYHPECRHRDITIKPSP